MADTEHLDLKSLPEKQRVAFYGAHFAMAADGLMQREELELICETLDTDGLSETVRRRLYAYAIKPPALQVCLELLSDASEAARHGLMLNLVEVAVRDYLLSEPEREALTEAQRILGIGDEQRAAMERYAEEVRRIRERGIDDNHATDALKAAVSGMNGEYLNRQSAR